LNNFIVAFSVVFPMLVMMLIGVFCGRKGILSPTLARQVDSINFRIFLPCLLFINVYQTDLAQNASADALLFALLLYFALVAFLVVIVPKIIRDPARISVVCQAIYRGNFVIFGLSITQSLYGEGNSGTAALMSSVIVPLMNITTVILMERYRPSGDGHVSVKKLVTGIVKNPLVIAGFSGLALLLLDIHLPEMVEDVFVSLSRAATPLAFTMLGATLSVEGFLKNRKILTLTVLVRMVLVPAVTLILSVLVGFRGPELAGLMVFFASPIAVSSFTMAQQMGADGELAGQLVALTSVTSLFTIFCITFLFQSLGFL